MTRIKWEMTAQTGAFIQLNRAGIKKAMLLALSAWLAFILAVILKVDNPYWAAMSVWVIAQSTRGVLVERAIYRVIGTLIGGWGRTIDSDATSLCGNWS